MGAADEKRERHLRNRRERIVELAAQLGIAIERRGQGWHLYGRGVDLACTDLAMLTETDLQPAPAVAT